MRLCAKPGLPTVFVDKVLLEHMCAYLFIVHGCFYIIMAELDSWDRAYTANKAENIYYLFPYRKSLPSPALDHVNCFHIFLCHMRY